MIRRIENQITLIFDDSLTIHGFPPNLPANKEGFKQFVLVLLKAFPDIKLLMKISLLKVIRLHAGTV
ncbi:MAG: hypothetical protein WAL79_10385 [Nitrososphaeraceae archaeon]